MRSCGLAGGGRDSPIGNRRALVRNLAHTRGADRVFVTLICTAQKRVEAGDDDALIEWRNAAACSRRHLRPDGYGIYLQGGTFHGFFLEYDRGTISARDYLEKFAAYYDCLASGRFERDYQGFPTILVVATSNAAEGRLGRAAEQAGVGRPLIPTVLLTTEWRIEHHPDGLLGPVWREPTSIERRPWPMRTSETTTAQYPERSS